MSECLHGWQKTVLERWMLPLGDLLTRQRVMRYFDLYRAAQWWERERLVAYQEQRLTELVRIAAAEVPFYQDLYRSAGIDSTAVRTRRDLSRLPIVTKRMLKEGYPERVTRRSGFRETELFTSGSTGEPFGVRIDAMTLSSARALMLLRATFSGWEIGDPLLQTGMSLRRGAVKGLKDVLLRTHYHSAFDLSNPALDTCLEVLDRRRIRYLMGYPVSLYLLARRAGETGFNHRLHGIVAWGDNLYRHHRRAIEAQFGARVTDTYGCGEGIQVAAQCTAGTYHVFMPHVLVEVVDDEGEPVAAGERGHILLTRLEPGAMPMIRYRIGDLGRRSTTESCPCGRRLETLAAIEGRESDLIRTPNGNRLIVHFFTGIFEYYPTIDNFQVRQESSDAVEVRIVPGKGFQGWELEKIGAEIREKGDRDLQVHFELVDRIEAPAGGGKRRFVLTTAGEK